MSYIFNFYSQEHDLILAEYFKNCCEIVLHTDNVIFMFF